MAPNTTVRQTRTGRAQRSERIDRTAADNVTLLPPPSDPSQPRNEGDSIPVEVVRKPLAELEIALTGRPVAPRRRDLGDGAAQLGCLDGQFEGELEARCALDRDGVEESPGIELEVVRR